MTRFARMVLVCFLLTILIGCSKPLFTAQAGSTTQPAVLIDDGAIRIAASAPSIDLPEKLVCFEPGAISLRIDAPVQQDFNVPKLGVASAVLIGLLLWWSHPPKWLRRK